MNRKRTTASQDAARLGLCILLSFTVGVVSDVWGVAPRVFAPSQKPTDHRLGPLKDLNGYFPLTVPDTAEQWRRRAEQLRLRVQVAAGLWPMPERTPLQAVVLGKSERPGFTVEKVHFQSLPGHYVTGLLFRPANPRAAALPAVLCPHGHGGRLMDYGQQGIREKIAQGEERFLQSGRYPKLARCAQLARMGCVAFIYDMVGYVDSQQIPGTVAHGLKDARPEMENPASWGFMTTPAELRLQSIFGLQTWNSIRALDFLCSLPDVDPHRLAVTGGSGGGTQTIVLGAIDPRPVASFPQGMVSTAMQGGCPCENNSLLRIGTGNVELAALFAPRPMAMTAANDWTINMMTKGFPELKQVYQLLGAPESVLCTSTVQFGHNFNYVTRTLMYHWLNQHLELGLETPILEDDFPALTEIETRVWDADHPAPPGGSDYERSLTKYLDEVTREQLDNLSPTDVETLERYRAVYGSAWQTLIGRAYPLNISPSRREISKTDRGSYWEFADVVSLPQHDEELPVVSLFPQQVEFNGHVVLWFDGQGKNGLYDAHGTPIASLSRLLGGGYAIVMVDVMGQGEFTDDGQPVATAPRVPNERAVPAYTYCYNDSLFAQRVHDVLTVVTYIRQHERFPASLTLVATGGAAPWCAAARTLCGPAIDRLVVDTQGFRFDGLTSVYDPQFIPGAVKYGDLPGLLSLSAPNETWIAGETEIPIVAAAFAALDKCDQLHWNQAGNVPTETAIVDWMISTVGLAH